MAGFDDLTDEESRRDRDGAAGGTVAPAARQHPEMMLAGTPAGPQRHLQNKEMAGTKVPAKFEQGGFTSRRRKDPKTLFPRTSPGNSAGLFSPQKLAAAPPRTEKMALGRGRNQPEFVLPRLQKKQCYQIVSIFSGLSPS
jgi:hypothetical protein